MDLAELADRQEITDRLHLYAEMLDSNQHREMPAAVFTEDCYEDHGEHIPPSIGREALADFVSDACRPFESTIHQVTNVRIDLNGDTATSRSYYLAIHWLVTEDGATGKPADFVSTGVYLDAWTRTDEGWRIARRERRNAGRSHLVTGTRPDHLLRMAAPTPET